MQWLVLNLTGSNGNDVWPIIVPLRQIISLMVVCKICDVRTLRTILPLKTLTHAETQLTTTKSCPMFSMQLLSFEDFGLVNGYEGTLFLLYHALIKNLYERECAFLYLGRLITCILV